MMKTDNEKVAFNARAKASMREYLRAKSWVEKVRSIERMNAASKIARASMRETQRKAAEAQTVLRAAE